MTNHISDPYLALARKWRPRTFDALQGHELVTKALTNALQSQRLHHAYLFTGTRGVGKTSIARLFAKALNCEQGITPEPCLKCSTCEAIEQGRLLDLIEIDAASKTRVEDTRDMLDNVQYAASTARFKIYLIDEVHMLSLHSFNALLKTLEEPPAHVKFLLATTDPQKIPVTILSRCLQFNLRPLSHEVISQQLKKITQEEQIQAENEALLLIAKAAKGSLRDALSLLDQTIATAGNTPISITLTKTLLGYTKQNYAIPLLEAIVNQDTPQIVALVQQIVIEGGNFVYVNDEILTILHQLAVAQQLAHTSKLKITTPELDWLAQHLSPEEIHLFYQIALKGGADMLQAPLLSLGFEMSMLRMLSFRPAVTNAVSAVPSLSEPRTKPLLTSSPSLSQDAELCNKPIASTPLNSKTEEPQTQIRAPEISDWPELVNSLRLTGMALSAINNAEFLKKEANQLILRIQKGHGSLFTPNVKARIETAFSQHFQEKITLLLQEETQVLDSIAKKQADTRQKAIQQAEMSLEQDAMLRDLQNVFSAEMVKDSIRLLEDDI